MNPTAPVLLFDGVCTLCNRAVQFVLRHERDGRILFASLQSDAGRDLMNQHNLAPGSTDSLVLVEDGQCYLRSDAALRVARHLQSPWRWLAVLRTVPRPLRDRVYDWVARNRYRWFGTEQACGVPPPGTRARFLDATHLAASPALETASGASGQSVVAFPRPPLPR